MEDGTVTLVGATTENPSFELNAALLSRARVIVFKPLDEAALENLLDASRGGRRQAAAARRGGPRLARAHGGRRRPRRALTLAEEVWRAAGEGEVFDAEHAAGHRPAPRADLRQGAGGPLQPDLGAAQDDPRLRPRRGPLLPRPHARRRRGPALHRPPARARGDRGHRPGRPAGARRRQRRQGRLRFPRLARRASWRWPRPRSISRPRRNRTPPTPPTRRRAGSRKEHGSLMPPKTILNAPTKLMKPIGYGDGYAYDHDEPEAFSGQDYWPEALGRQRSTTPSERGFEREVRKRLEWWAEAAPRARRGGERPLKHDPEKWRPVFGKDHAQTRRAARHRRRPSGAARRRRRAAAPSARARDQAPCRHGRCGPRPRPRA